MAKMRNTNQAHAREGRVLSELDEVELAAVRAEGTSGFVILGGDNAFGKETGFRYATDIVWCAASTSQHVLLDEKQEHCPQAQQESGKFVRCNCDTPETCQADCAAPPEQLMPPGADHQTTNPARHFGRRERRTIGPKG